MNEKDRKIAIQAALIDAGVQKVTHMEEELKNALILLWMVQEDQTIPPAELQNRIDAISEILAPTKG